MKYNLSKIMTRAWEIKKANLEGIFSICLKMAWAEAKNEKEIIEIPINGLKGTDRQKKYAEDLISNIIWTVQANTAGYHTEPNGSVRYTEQKTADAVKATYIFVKFAISTKKTYGEIIDVLKHYDILAMANKLKIIAANNHETVFDSVNNMISSCRSTCR